MHSWLITVPVWGERYRKLFRQNGLPSMKAALQRASLPAKFLIATDDPADVARDDPFYPHDVEFRSLVSGEGKYETYGHGHRDALTQATENQFIAFFPGDVVVSVEIFEACERHLLNGKKAVAYAGMRSLEGEPPPIGASATELCRWSMRNMHQWIKDCHWNNGTSLDPAYLFFNDGTNDNTILRSLVLGPLALVNDRKLQFDYTSDVNLLACYTEDEIYVVRRMDELFATDVSSVDQTFPTGDQMTPQAIADYVKKIGLGNRNKWYFSQPIVVNGSPDATLGQTTAEEILAKWDTK